MLENTPVIYDYILIGVFVAAVLSATSLLFVNAPYGRHAQDGWGPKIPTRLGWILMESPASLVFAWFFFTGENWSSTVPLILFGLWQLHYFHRSFIYPFQIKVNPNRASEPLVVLAMGSFYCAINGYLNGSFTSTYGQHLNDEWLTDPRFIIGVALFCFGYWLNKKSDRQLRELRATSTEYQIPYGYGFKYVSMPNYLGEIITWIGFATASWSLAGLSFVVFTMANLVPRAVTNHKWYLEKFEDYPKDRKAVIPFIL